MLVPSYHACPTFQKSGQGGLLQSNIMFPQQPSAHSPYEKTPRLKNIFEKTRSKSIDRNDDGQRETNVSSTDENPTTIGNLLDNNDRRHWMTIETNGYEGNRFSECIGIGVASSGGVAKAFEYSKKRSGRRRGSSADAPRDGSPWRPHQGARSHGGQTTRRTNLAPFDEALTSTSCPKPSFVGDVNGDVSSLRESPESAKRNDAGLCPNCKEGMRCETGRAMGTDTNIQRENKMDANVAGRDRPIAVSRVRGSPPKQPVAVRRLKMTLQQLNGL